MVANKELVKLKEKLRSEAKPTKPLTEKQLEDIKIVNEETFAFFQYSQGGCYIERK